MRWGSSADRFRVSELGDSEIVRDDKKKRFGKGGEERIRVRVGGIATAIWVPASEEAAARAFADAVDAARDPHIESDAGNVSLELTGRQSLVWAHADSGNVKVSPRRAPSRVRSARAARPPRRRRPGVPSPQAGRGRAASRGRRRPARSSAS